VIENVRTANGETISVDNDGTVEENSQTEKPFNVGRSAQLSVPSLAQSRVAVRAPLSVLRSAQAAAQAAAQVLSSSKGATSSICRAARN
jgi:hypothetical protein